MTINAYPNYAHSRTLQCACLLRLGSERARTRPPRPATSGCAAPGAQDGHPRDGVLPMAVLVGPPTQPVHNLIEFIPRHPTSGMQCSTPTPPPLPSPESPLPASPAPCSSPLPAGPSRQSQRPQRPPRAGSIAVGRSRAAGSSGRGPTKVPELPRLPPPRHRPRDSTAGVAAAGGTAAEWVQADGGPTPAAPRGMPAIEPDLMGHGGRMDFFMGAGRRGLRGRVAAAGGSTGVAGETAAEWVQVGRAGSRARSPPRPQPLHACDGRPSRMGQRARGPDGHAGTGRRGLGLRVPSRSAPRA